MRFFTSGKQHERARRFDHFQGTAETALRDTQIAELLGPIALELAAVNRGSFLPNVRFGVVSLPRKYRNTDQLPVLPKLPTDGTLRPDSSALMPTARNVAFADAALQSRDGEGTPPLRPREIRRAIRKVGSGIRAKHVNPRVPHVNAVHAAVRGILVLGRPLLALPPGEIDKPPLVQQSDALHELMHGKDYTDTLPDPNIQTSVYAKPWLEVRGNIAGAAPMVVAWENDAIDAGFMNEHLGITVTIVNESRELGLEPQQILSDTFVCGGQNGQLDEMACAMMAYGIIGPPGAE